LAAGNKKQAAANGYTGEFTGLYAAEHSGAKAFEVLAAALPTAPHTAPGAATVASACDHPSPTA
jgi:hypothetical protein